MSDEKVPAGGESIFAQPTEQKGFFEQAATPDAAPDAPAEPATASANPFATGTTSTEPAPQAAAEPAATAEEDGAESYDATVYVRIDSTQLMAEAVAEPPSGAGQPVSREMIQQALDKAGVSFGILEEGFAELLKPSYDQPVAIAQGVPPQDGKDGVCKELFPRTMTAKVQEREDGSVDYKELGLINDVKEGTVICEITPPEDGVDGTSVKGQQLKARSGQKALPPLGEFTALAEDGLSATTTASGNLVFRNDRFTVDTIYRVQDVNYDIGNITFSGDVHVTGDILDGFKIRSGGNITLDGRVGSVQLEAKGDISIKQGVNGTGKAEIVAAGNMNAGFIENCSIRVNGNITAGSIINSNVECEGDIEVTSNKHGIICGGRITAFGSIKAKEVGNESNTPTLITLGITPGLLKDRKKYVDQLADVSRHIEEMEKNTAYIEKMVSQQREVPAERIQLLQKTKLTLPITEKKRDQLKGKIAEIEERMAAATNSTLTAKIIYPPTKVSIGTLSIGITDQKSNALVYKSKDGEIVVGSA